jgi:AraC-like DNA-binding protein
MESVPNPPNPNKVTDRQVERFSAQIRPRDFYLQMVSSIPDVNVFIKDAGSRWMMCDDGFVAMLGCRAKSEVIGKTDSDFFPPHLAEVFLAGDRQVMRSGEPLLNQYEMVLKDDFSLEWYVTHKFPLWNEAGAIIGIAGINARAGRVESSPVDDPQLGRALEYMRTHYGGKIGVEELAETAGMSRRSFERHFHNVLGCSSMTYLRRVRINSVCRAILNSSRTLPEISLSCGFSDQSHMTREFRKMVGETPRAFRLRRKSATRPGK